MYFEHLTEDLLDGRVEVLLELDGYLQDVGFEVFNVIASPWSTTVQHLIKNDAQTPNVALVIKILAGQNLRGSVKRSAQKTKFLGFGGIFDYPTEPEIAKFSDTLLEKYIRGLDVAVDDAFLREGIIAQHEMPHEDEYLIFAEAAGFVPLEVGLEIAIVAVLEDEVEVLLVAEAVVEFDDEGRGQGLEVCDLVLYLLLDRFSNLIDADTFDGYVDSVLA